MLHYSAKEIIGDADIQRPARAFHYIREIVMLSHIDQKGFLRLRSCDLSHSHFAQDDNAGR